METRPKGVLREAAFDGSKDLREAPLVGRLVVVVRPVVVVAQDKMVLEKEEKVALSAVTGVDMRKVFCRVSMFCVGGLWRSSKVECPRCVAVGWGVLGVRVGAAGGGGGQKSRNKRKSQVESNFSQILAKISVLRTNAHGTSTA